jgi:peptidyl-prolyl cis-trans isomerase C
MTLTHRLGRWMKEPLVHFVVLGAALVAAHQWLAPPLPRHIVLSEAVIRGLRQDYLRRNGARPTLEEEAALIQHFIDDEVQYREALALGLDRGDIIVRRRLVQKMEFLTEDAEPIPEPTDDQLRSYLGAHAERYALPERVAITHVFISTDRHGSEAPALARALRDALMNGADPSRLGDPFLRGRDIALSTEQELAAIFGNGFAARVIALPPGVWSEPLPSSYGLHLARVTNRASGRHPDLTEIRAAVRRDWREEQRTAANRAALDRLRRQYDIRIEGPAVADGRNQGRTP